MGWSRRIRESPGQDSEPDKTQLTLDLDGSTLAIDTLLDNGTRVVVSARGLGRKLGGGPEGSPGTSCVRPPTEFTKITYSLGWPWKKAERKIQEKWEWFFCLSCTV